MLRAVANGAVELMHNNVTKLATTAIGLDLTGGMDIKGSDYVRLRFLNGSTFKAGIEVATSTNDMISGAAVNDLAIRAQANMLFSTGGNTERVRIDSGGKVHINEAVGRAQLNLSLGNVTGAGQFASSQLNLSNPTNVNAISQITFGYDAVGLTNAASYIGYLNGSSSSNGKGSLVFGTRNAVTDTQPTERMRIDSVGNVGIGTTVPSTQLTVKNDSNNTSFGENNIITIQNASTTDNSRMGLAFTGNTGIGSGLAIIEAQSYDQSAGHTSLNFSVYNGSWHNDMMVLKAGLVGIGTASPYGRLELNGSGNEWNTAPGLRMWDSANNKGWFVGTANNTTAGDFYIRSLPSISANPGSSQQQFTIKHTGKVGIGTTAPTAPLEVFSEEIGNGANKGIRIVSNGAVKKYSIRTGITGAENTSFAIHDDTASANRLVISTAGNVTVPGTLHSPGHVIQTVYAQSGGLVTPSQTNGDYINLIQVNITPKYATSKILINGIAAVSLTTGHYPALHARIYRDSTLAKQYHYWGYEGNTNTHRILNEPVYYLDSPTTTSALTYYVKIANTSGSSFTGTYAGRGNQYNASTITVQEIAQ